MVGKCCNLFMGPYIALQEIDKSGTTAWRPAHGTKPSETVVERPAVDTSVLYMKQEDAVVGVYSCRRSLNPRRPRRH